MKLEEKLICLRKQKELSQMELAEKLGVSRQAIYKWESGAAMPTTDNLLYLSKLYGVSVNDLIDHEIELTDRFDETEEKTSEPETGVKQRGLKKYFAIAALVLITILLTVLVYRGVTHEGSQTLTFEQMESKSWNMSGTNQFSLDTDW